MPPLSLAAFADELTTIMDSMTREVAKRQSGEFYKIKVTLPQIILLNTLKVQGPQRMTDLAKALHVTTAAITGIVDRLVRDGYVVRFNDQHDRRLVKIKLTGKGDTIAGKVRCHRREIVIDMFGKVPPEDREEYLRILKHVYEHINT